MSGDYAAFEVACEHCETKRMCVIFFVIDRSGKMAGTRIQAVNTYLRGLIKEISEDGVSNESEDIRISVLSFADTFEWMNPLPLSAREFVWRDLAAGGRLNLGAALAELQRKMSRGEFFADKGSDALFVPIVIFLMSSGNQESSYDEELITLWENKYFQNSLRVALPVGRHADIRAIAGITGNSEFVFKPAGNPDDLAKRLRDIKKYCLKLIALDADTPTGKALREQEFELNENDVSWDDEEVW